MKQSFENTEPVGRNGGESAKTVKPSSTLTRNGIFLSYGAISADVLAELKAKYGEEPEKEEETDDIPI